MKIRMLTSIASATWAYQFGELVDLDIVTGLDWVKKGIAELVTEDRGLLTNMVAPIANAMSKRPRGRPKKGV